MDEKGISLMGIKIIRRTIGSADAKNRVPTAILGITWRLALFLLILSPIVAQDDVVPLDADNLTNLQSALTIDFANLPDDIGAVDSGWFVLSDDGSRVAVVRQDGGLVVFDTVTGDIAETYAITGEDGEPTAVLDADFDGETVTSLHSDGMNYLVAIGDERYPLDVGLDMPVRLWLDGSSIWLEVLALDDPHYVMQIPLDGSDITTLPSGPENDMDAYVRIGRIPAPLAITSTADGLVKRWNLETGAVTAEVQLETPPVFGRVDETTGRHLAWRDPESQGLYLLDFETGDNQFVAELGGEYIQALLLSPQADVIVAVATGDDESVSAWDVETGAFTLLGPYRECSRVPDMIRLSADGTTLVIGCDTGLDIWRVTD